VSGLIIGALFGKIPEGILLGSVFQLFFLGGLPIGRDIPPDSQGAGIAACGSYFLLGNNNPPESALLGAVIIGLAASVLGGSMEILVRRLNEKLYHLFMRHHSWLHACHLGGVATAYLRGIVLFIPLFFIARILHLPHVLVFTKELLLIIAVSVGVAHGFYLFVKKTTMIYFILGIACALVSFVF
jgi:mannose/fructose/N-acetylgalactosamine-specific phosphotransferase system component IIC